MPTNGIIDRSMVLVAISEIAARSAIAPKNGGADGGGRGATALPVVVLPLPAAREMCRRKACFSEGSRADREAGERTSKAKCPQGAAHERYGQRTCVPATARRRRYIDNHQCKANKITSGGEEERRIR